MIEQGLKSLRIVWPALIVTVMIMIGADASADESAGANAAAKTAIPACVGTFEPDRFLLSTGSEHGSDRVVLSPEVGVSHTVREREQPGNIDSITHKVHAQAGGRVSLYGRFYLGFATKLPIYNYEATNGDSAAGLIQKQTQARHDYELLRLSPDNLSMTGEVGYSIGQRLHLNIYYDQNRYNNPAVRGCKDEDVFGTRMIFRFK
jgi:hypothetical protein